MTDHADIDHTGLTGVGGGSGNPLIYDMERRTAGDITINDTAAGSFSDTSAAVPDLVVAAVTGDLLQIGLNTYSVSPGAVSLRVDVASIVSASAVNFVSSLTGTPAANGVSGWFAHASVSLPVTGVLPYVVQAGDLSGGNITLRLCGWVSSSSRVLIASATAPLVFWVQNLGQ